MEKYKKNYADYKKTNLTKLEKGDHFRLKFGIDGFLWAMRLIFVRFRLGYNHQNAEKKTVFDSDIYNIIVINIIHQKSHLWRKRKQVASLFFEISWVFL